jgi:hypothetical protein
MKQPSIIDLPSILKSAPGRFRGGTSNLEKKLNIRPDVLYGTLTRPRQLEATVYLDTPYAPVETMPVENLLELPMFVYFGNIGPRLNHSRQMCGRMRTLLANINRHYLLNPKYTWTHTTMKQLVAIVAETPRSQLRVGPISGSGTVDAFYECLNARNLLPPRSSGK